MSTKRDQQAFKRMADATARKYTLYNVDDAAVLAHGGAVGGKRPEGADELRDELLVAASYGKLGDHVQGTDAIFLDLPPQKRGELVLAPHDSIAKWMAANFPDDAYFLNTPLYSSSKAAGPQGKLTRKWATALGAMLRYAKLDDPAGLKVFFALLPESVSSDDSKVMYSSALNLVPAKPAPDHSPST